MFNDLYLSSPQVSCFDGDGGDGGDAAAAAAAKAKTDADAAAAAAAGGGGGGGDDGKSFNKDDVNRIVQERLSRDRESREAAHQEKYKDLETRYTELLSEENLGEETRTKLTGQLEDVRKQLRTKDQEAAHQRKLLQDGHDVELTKAVKSAESWESRFRESSITRELQDAAVTHDAYEAGQIVALLRPMTKLVEVVDETTNEPTGEYKTVVDFPDVDAKDQAVMTQRTPTEAVKRMKEVVTSANLFRSNVVAGVGAGNATGGVTPGANGKVDVRKLSTEQYMKLRKENPELLGLK